MATDLVGTFCEAVILAFGMSDNILQFRLIGILDFESMLTAITGINLLYLTPIYFSVPLVESVDEDKFL